ncbi:MAG: hypothetical protein ACRD0W_25555, partial [Acidimicrobiales bacterium]
PSHRSVSHTPAGKPVIVPKVRHVPGDDEAGAWLGPVTVAPDVLACLSEEKVLDLLHEHYAKRPALFDGHVLPS